MRQKDSWPTHDAKSVMTVARSNCKFLNPKNLGRMR